MKHETSNTFEFYTNSANTIHSHLDQITASNLGKHENGSDFFRTTKIEKNLQTFLATVYTPSPPSLFLAPIAAASFLIVHFFFNGEREREKT